MLIDDIERYLALRRSLGFKLEQVAEYLQSFACFAAARGEHHIRAQTAIEWAQTAPTAGARYNRLRDVVRAARFLHLEDPAHEIPPPGFFVRSRNKFIPYIFTPDDLLRILNAAVELHRHQYYAVQRQRYAMLFGLIAATGLRITEALDLRLGDILPGGILHIRETKFGKSRLVPLHPTVREALDRYLGLRRDFVGLVDCLFLSARGRRLSYAVVNKAFREIVRHADIAPGRARQPRIHDLRHTFATRVLEQCGAGREAIARHAVALMTYMGHTDLRYTYWYLQATPELMIDIAAAAEALVVGEVR
ncbi:MAG: tyrosine-type recombinase/integrase [Alphaproteobacteria bacterium]